jgi:hypothetical protein
LDGCPVLIDNPPTGNKWTNLYFRIQMAWEEGGIQKSAVRIVG